IVELAARLRVPWTGVAGAPVDEVEIRIVRAGDPGRRAAVLVRVAGRPRVGAGLARPRGRVAPPQMPARLGIPAVDEAADPELGAGDSGEQDAVGDQRGDGHRIALGPVGGL